MSLYTKKEIEWLLNEKYNRKKTKEFYNDVQRLKKGEPIDYVIGFVNFLGSKIDLSLHPLIPRIETEYWVELAIQRIKKQGIKNPHILDIFSGSGCIGISVLKYIKNSHVDFTDNSIRSVEQIRINLNINHIKKENYNIIKSNIFSKITRKYDYIFANPPYVDIKKKTKLPLSVRKFEPLTSIIAKDNGLFYIKTFLKQAKDYLRKGGIIYLEFDSPQKRLIKNLIEKYGYKKYNFYKDQYNKWRWVEIQ